MAETNPAGIPIDEGDLLALVEGEPIPSARRAAIERALQSHPQLAIRVKAMQSDLAAVQACGRSDRAPAGLVDAVIAAVEPTMERRMLLGLETGRPAADPIPISRYQPQRVSVLRSILAGRGPRLAAAAAVLLAVGAATYLMIPAASPPSRSPIAIAPTDGPESVEDSAALAAQESAPAQAEIPVLARGSEDKPQQGRQTPGQTTLAAAEPATEHTVASTPQPDLVKLASERRLVLVVRAADIDTACRLVERAANRGTLRSQGWRVSSGVPGPVQSVLARGSDSPSPFPSRPSMPPPREVTLTSASFQTREVMTGFLRTSAPVRPLIEPDAGDRMYMIESRLDAASIEAARQALGGAGAEASVRVLEEPLPGDSEVLNPAAVFWWKEPPSAWTRWGSIPLIIEHAD